MTAAYLRAPQQRGPERSAPLCARPGCGLPLGEATDMPATPNHGPARIRRCAAGHTVVLPPEREHDFDLRPQVTEGLEG